jgi:TRAP transporter TAXI family solute receptor
MTRLLQRKNLTTALFTAVLTLATALPAVAAERTLVTIGTGSETGVYYPVSKVSCRLLNKGRNKHGIRCSAESTGGSVDNINTIRGGELDIGVAQYDWQYNASNGTGNESFNKADCSRNCARYSPCIRNLSASLLAMTQVLRRSTI